MSCSGLITREKHPQPGLRREIHRVDCELAREDKDLRAKRVEGGLPRDRPVADGGGGSDRRARENIIEVTVQSIDRSLEARCVRPPPSGLDDGGRHPTQ